MIGALLLCFQTIEKCGCEAEIAFHELGGFLRPVHTCGMDDEVTI
jgi:hypothetical protein